MFKYYGFFKRQKLPIKILIVLASILILIGAYLTLAYCSGSLLKTLRRGEESVFYYAFKDESGKPITLMLYVVATFIILRSILIRYNHNNVSDKDERGVNFMEQSTYGSSRWMRESEIDSSFEVNNIKNTTTTIFGQLGKKGREVVGWKENKSGGSGNRNVVCIASMGSGKSFCYVRTELIQAVLRGDSFVVTDPSAELYNDLAKFCMNRNYDVKVLNLADPSHSDFWNCLEETIDPETERLDSTRLNDFAAIYMKNSGEGKDDFWYNSALNLLKAAIAYTAWQKEKSIIDGYLSVYKKITGVTSDQFTRSLESEMVSFKWCRKFILKTAYKAGLNIEEVASTLEDIDKYAPKYPYTMGQVVYNLLHFKTVEQQMPTIPEWHPANINYLVYATNDTENVRKSALQGIQLRVQLLFDNRIKEILSHDGIHLADANKRQSAYFVIMSDKSTATKPIASLFFSFLFKDAQDNFDEQAQIAKERGVKNPCLNLVTMLDEFFSIGVIGGSPEAFGVTMSNSRKRNIFISVIIQAYSQLEALYGPQIKDVIQGGCSTLLYLGGNDPQTCKFISEFASGESTILSEQHDEYGLLHVSDYAQHIRTDRRFLLTTDEARRWKNAVLVVKQGEYPLKLKPFPWIEHPCYLNGEMISNKVSTNIKSLDLRLEEMLSKQIEDVDNYLKDKINESCGNRKQEIKEPILNEQIESENKAPVIKNKGSKKHQSTINL